jgi:hypothetical protein
MNDVIALFPPGATVDDGGELVAGGCRLRDLAGEFGTPAYVDPEVLAPQLPRRERVLKVNHRFARRMLDARAAWLQEAELRGAAARRR